MDTLLPNSNYVTDKKFSAFFLLILLQNFFLHQNLFSFSSKLLLLLHQNLFFFSQKLLLCSPKLLASLGSKFAPHLPTKVSYLTANLFITMTAKMITIIIVLVIIVLAIIVIAVIIFKKNLSL